jgi:hypothetical protein
MEEKSRGFNGDQSTNFFLAGEDVHHWGLQNDKTDFSRPNPIGFSYIRG